MLKQLIISLLCLGGKLRFQLNIPVQTILFRCGTGKGIRTLRSAGIEVVEGVEEAICRKANEVFIHRMLTSQPFVTLRCELLFLRYDLGFNSTSIERKYCKLIVHSMAVNFVPFFF